MSFKPLTMSAQVTYVSSADPAVDWDAIVAAELELHPDVRDSDKPWDAKRAVAEEKFLERYTVACLKDPAVSLSMLKIKQGEQPTKFVIGVIPPEEMSRIADECRLGGESAMPSQAKWRAFLSSIRDVQNFGAAPVPKRKVGDVEYVEPAWLNKSFARGLREIALGVGIISWRWNQLREDEIKN